jgi:hypothetical protein
MNVLRMAGFSLVDVPATAVQQDRGSPGNWFCVP